MTTVSTHVDADRALRSAHEAVYRWAEWFSGFSAQVLLDGAGGQAQGALHVRPGAPMDLEMEDLAEVDRAWVTEQLQSMVAHRAPLEYEAADGRHPKQLVAGPRGQEAVVRVDDAMRSRYWLEDGEISQIERTLGEVRVTVAIQSRTPAGAGALARDVTVFWRDGDTGRLRSLELLRDEHVALGEVVLPSRRRSLHIGADGSAVVRDLRLVAHSAERIEEAA